MTHIFNDLFFFQHGQVILSSEGGMTNVYIITNHNSLDKSSFLIVLILGFDKQGNVPSGSNSLFKFNLTPKILILITCEPSKVCQKPLIIPSYYITLYRIEEMLHKSGYLAEH